MTALKLAVSKGYLLKEAMVLFAKAGIEFEDDLNTSRKLFTYSKSGDIQLLQVRPWDVPLYVERGAADWGIVGRDVLTENPADVLTLMDLKFGYCRLILAGEQGKNLALRHHLRIATKYPNSTQSYFQSKGLKVHIMKLYGAIELAPITGLSDLICDLTATGQTLKENQLEIVDTVFESSALLIANPVSFRVHYQAIMAGCETLRRWVS